MVLLLLFGAFFALGVRKIGAETSIRDRDSGAEQAEAEGEPD